MYVTIVVLTMFLLPAAAIPADYTLHPHAAPLVLIGKWFVFWGVGVRLGLAGLRQFFQPAFTAKQIFHTDSDEALPLVRELGIANLATGVVGIASLAAPSFVLPVAILAGIFYGVAGVRHISERGRSQNENVALVSDLFMFVVLALFVFFALRGNA
ncbi:MAG: DUF6790 family protein [Stellaceae bacterium]